MDSELEKYRKAGRIAWEVRQEVARILKPGIRLLEIADLVEQKIREKGGRVAFPLNTSLNEVAAHYVPGAGDTREVKDGDLLKLDLGVEVDGFIADTAFTYCSEKNGMIEASEKSIEEAVKVIRPGVAVGEVSETIEETVKGMGFGLIVNLTGHGLEKDQFHAPPTIPNVSTKSPVVLEEGDVIALEPFVASSNGQVRESAPSEIFRFIQERPIRMMEAREILKKVQENYRSFPFAKRWLQGYSIFRLSLALQQLEMAEALESYPPLKETRGQRIAQAEHTIIVSDPPIVVTKP